MSVSDLFVITNKGMSDSAKGNCRWIPKLLLLEFSSFQFCPFLLLLSIIAIFCAFIFSFVTFLLPARCPPWCPAWWARPPQPSSERWSPWTASCGKRFICAGGIKRRPLWEKKILEEKTIEATQKIVGEKKKIVRKKEICWEKEIVGKRRRLLFRRTARGLWGVGVCCSIHNEKPKKTKLKNSDCDGNIFFLNSLGFHFTSTWLTNTVSTLVDCQLTGSLYTPPNVHPPWYTFHCIYQTWPQSTDTWLCNI